MNRLVCLAGFGLFLSNYAAAGTATIAHCSNENLAVEVTQVSVNPNSAFTVISVTDNLGNVEGFDSKISDLDPLSFEITGQSSRGDIAVFTRQGSTAFLSLNGKPKQGMICTQAD